MGRSATAGQPQPVERDSPSARSASLDTRPSTTNSTGSTCSRKSAWAGRPRQPQRQDDRERKKTKPQTDRKTLFINTQKTQRHKQSITFRQESKRETKTHQAQPAANNATQKYEDKTSKTSQDKTKKRATKQDRQEAKREIQSETQDNEDTKHYLSTHRKHSNTQKTQ